MYGGMDRQANPTLRQGDATLIEGTSKAFGSRRRASEAFADKAFRDYAQGRSNIGIRRFNQAWLIDPSNPESYWGFALWYRHLGDQNSAKSMMQKAYRIGLREKAFLDTYKEIVR